MAWIFSVSGLHQESSLANHLFALSRLVQQESHRNLGNRPLREELAGPVYERFQGIACSIARRAKKKVQHKRTQRHLESIGRHIPARDFRAVSTAARETLRALVDKKKVNTSNDAVLTVHEAELFERALLHCLRDHWAMQRNSIWGRLHLGSTFTKERQNPSRPAAHAKSDGN